VVEFEPEHFQQQAGLVCYYGGAKFHYLYISHDETLGKHLRVMSSLPNHVQIGRLHGADRAAARLPVQLRVEVDEERLVFAYRTGGGDWQWLAQQFDASILSDEASAPGQPNFTGAFVGMACQDMAGSTLHADFDYFEYRERLYVINSLRLPGD
jgi:xylan 1,4-beta-xylosidase